MINTELLIKKATGNIFTERFPSLNSEKYILVIPSKQILLLISNSVIIFSYPVSTSKFGIGNLNDSFKTPPGLHYIAERIGENMPKMTIFKGRKPITNNLTLDDLDLPQNTEIRDKHFETHDDMITSRILWLKAMKMASTKATILIAILVIFIYMEQSMKIKLARQHPMDALE